MENSRVTKGPPQGHHRVTTGSAQGHRADLEGKQGGGGEGEGGYMSGRQEGHRIERDAPPFQIRRTLSTTLLPELRRLPRGWCSPSPAWRVVPPSPRPFTCRAISWTLLPDWISLYPDGTSTKMQSPTQARPSTASLRDTWGGGQHGGGTHVWSVRRGAGVGVL